MKIICLQCKITIKEVEPLTDVRILYSTCNGCGKSKKVRPPPPMKNGITHMGDCAFPR